MKAGYLAATLLIGFFCLVQQALPEDKPLVVACERLGHQIKWVPPEYPQVAKAAHIQGDVVLGAIINKKGRIKQLHVISGNPILAQSAMDAVRQWRYKPYTVEKRKVEVETQITVKYHM